MMTLLLQPASAGTAARQSRALAAAAAIRRQRLTTEMLPNIIFLAGGVWRATRRPREALIVSFAHMLHIVLPHRARTP
jgi:hypothetical protein